MSLIADVARTAAREKAGHGARDFRVLLVLGGVVLVAWSLVVPIFESPDEYLHWQYARYLHDEWRLPTYHRFFAQGNQPPLYYAAVAIAATRTEVPPPLGWLDGHGEVTIPFAPRFYLTASDDLRHYWPIRLVRLLSAAMSLATAWLCGCAARTITGKHSTAILAAGLAVFLPQFAFRGTSVANDVLLATSSAWLTLLLARWVCDGYSWRIGALTALALAGAYLSKINGICLVSAVALVIVTDPVDWRTRASRLWVLGVFLLLVLPWSLRNVMLYGDPFASEAMSRMVPDLIVSRSWWDVDHVRVLPRELFKSFIGWFGYQSVKLPKWVYALYLAFMLFAMSGLVRAIAAARRQPDGGRRLLRVSLVLLTIILVNYLVIVRINTQFIQRQGRYLFPALPAIVVAVAIGLEAWWPWSRAPVRSSRVTIGAWAAANLAILAWVVVPAFNPPLLASISRVSTPIAASPIAGLVPDGANAYIVDGEQPELSSAVRVAAEDARFITFEIEAAVPVAEAAGDVVLTLERATHGDRVECRLPFRWLPDGRQRLITLTTLNQPDWRGAVVQVRIVLLADNGAAFRGHRLRLGDIRLAGSIRTFPP